MIGTRKTTISTAPSGTRAVRPRARTVWSGAAAGIRNPTTAASAYRYYEMPAYTDICFAKDLHGQIGFRCVKKQPAKQ